MATINRPSKELVRQWLMERQENRNPLPEMTRIQHELGWTILKPPVPAMSEVMSPLEAALG